MEIKENEPKDSLTTESSQLNELENKLENIIGSQVAGEPVLKSPDNHIPQEDVFIPEGTIPDKITPSGKVAFSPMLVQQQNVKRMQDYITLNHQNFFNAEVQDIKELSINEIKDRIEFWAEAYFGAEAEATRLRTKLQAASSVFNDKVKKLTESERDAQKISDSSYIPKLELANPLKKKSKPSASQTQEKKSKDTKKSLEQGLADLLGFDEEKLKKLGL